MKKPKVFQTETLLVSSLVYPTLCRVRRQRAIMRLYIAWSKIISGVWNDRWMFRLKYRFTFHTCHEDTITADDASTTRCMKFEYHYAIERRATLKQIKTVNYLKCTTLKSNYYISLYQ